MLTGTKISQKPQLEIPYNFRRNQTANSASVSASARASASHCLLGRLTVLLGAKWCCVHLCSTITIWFPCSSYTWPIQPIDHASSKQTHSLTLSLGSQINTFSFDWVAVVFPSFWLCHRCLFRIFIVISRLLFFSPLLSFPHSYSYSLSLSLSSASVAFGSLLLVWLFTVNFISCTLFENYSLWCA